MKSGLGDSFRLFSCDKLITWRAGRGQLRPQFIEIGKRKRTTTGSKIRRIQTLLIYRHFPHFLQCHIIRVTFLSIVQFNSQDMLAVAVNQELCQEVLGEVHAFRSEFLQ